MSLLQIINIKLPLKWTIHIINIVLFSSLSYIFRDASLFILSSPIVWKSPQRYDIVRKLGEYRNSNCITYEALVSDTVEYGPSIPGIEWYKRLSPGVGKSNETFLCIAYGHRSKGGSDPFRTSESIRYFQRCVYEHYIKDYRKYVRFHGHLKVIKLLYRISYIF